MISLASLLAALLAAPAGAGSHGEPATLTLVSVEVFTVGLGGTGADGLVFTRSEGVLTGGTNPDQRVREIGGREASEIVLLHSTSWRWEPDGRVVLTYLAWARDGSLPGTARLLPKLAPPGPTDPLHPRPAQIRELDPLAHGLRHLAFLLRTGRDGALAAALGPRATALLAKLEPEVAGELTRP